MLSMSKIFSPVLFFIIKDPLLEHGYIRNFFGYIIGQQQKNHIDYRIEEANGGGIAHISVQHAFSINVGGYHIRCLIGGWIIQQQYFLSAYIEYTAHTQDKQHNDRWQNAGYGNMDYL